MSLILLLSGSSEQGRTLTFVQAARRVLQAVKVVDGHIGLKAGIELPRLWSSFHQILVPSPFRGLTASRRSLAFELSFVRRLFSSVAVSWPIQISANLRGYQNGYQTHVFSFQTSQDRCREVLMVPKMSACHHKLSGQNTTTSTQLLTDIVNLRQSTFRHASNWFKKHISC